MNFSNGVFVGAKFTPSSAEMLRDYASELGLEPLPLADMHVTIMYSKTPPKRPYPLIKSEFFIPVLTYKLVYIGNAIAFTLQSDWLKSRRDLAIVCGMRNKFGSYIAHVSLAYDPPKNLILLQKSMQATLFLESEYMEPLKA